MRSAAPSSSIADPGLPTIRRAAGGASVALFLVVAWLLAAVAMLAAQGKLVAFLVAVVPASTVVLVLRALVRQQRAPSPLDQPWLPHRYRVADDLRQPIAAMVEAAEAEA